MTTPQSPGPDAIKTIVKTLRNPGPDARRYSRFFDSVADALESLSRSPLSGTGREEVDVPRFMEVVRSRWNYEPDQFNVIEQVLSDPECVAVLSLSHEAPAQEPVADESAKFALACEVNERISKWIDAGKQTNPYDFSNDLVGFVLANAAPASHATRFQATTEQAEPSRDHQIIEALKHAKIDLEAAKVLAQHTLGEPHGINQTLALIEAALASIVTPIREDRVQAGTEQGHHAAELRAALDNYMEALSIENDGYADYTREATFKLEQLLWANKGTLIAAIAPIPAEHRPKELASSEPLGPRYDGTTMDNQQLDGTTRRNQPVVTAGETATADDGALPSRGTFLGFKIAEGHEMHCANTFCPHQSKCAKGCINQVARPLTPPDKTFPANGIKS